MGAAGAHEQRVAVRGRLRHRGGTDHAARASTILDDHRLSELFTEVGRDDSSNHIDAAAGDKRHDDLERLIGIILRVGG